MILVDNLFELLFCCWDGLKLIVDQCKTGKKWNMLKIENFKIFEM